MFNFTDLSTMNVYSFCLGTLYKSPLKKDLIDYVTKLFYIKVKVLIARAGGYYNSPKCIIINFSYSLVQQLCFFLLNINWLVH